MKTGIKEKVWAAVAAVFIVCGLIGLHYDDWTAWVLVIPFGWIILGCLLDFAINGKNTSKRSGFVAILCALILVNMCTIIVHRDTSFIVGRLLCSLGCVILIVNTATLNNDGRAC